jgi:hypothetical protein
MSATLPFSGVRLKGNSPPTGSDHQARVSHPSILGASLERELTLYRIRPSGSRQPPFHSRDFTERRTHCLQDPAIRLASATLTFSGLHLKGNSRSTGSGHQAHVSHPSILGTSLKGELTAYRIRPSARVSHPSILGSSLERELTLYRIRPSGSCQPPFHSRDFTERRTHCLQDPATGSRQPPFHSRGFT